MTEKIVTPLIDEAAHSSLAGFRRSRSATLHISPEAQSSDWGVGWLLQQCTLNSSPLQTTTQHVSLYLCVCLSVCACLCLTCLRLHTISFRVTPWKKDVTISLEDRCLVFKLAIATHTHTPSSPSLFFPSPVFTLYISPSLFSLSVYLYPSPLLV